ncbi:MAG: hypothetical protein MJY87_10635 [Fibrobacter sp.]|nr:hypothetical protein [Fibrobacter sp.]
MSAYVSDSVYFIGSIDAIEFLWSEYRKAQHDAVQAAIEHSKQNSEDFFPFIDEINENNTIYHGSVGVLASKFSIDDKGILVVYTTGDIYGNGFRREGDTHTFECNPVLVRLDPKLWNSGNIQRADKTFFSGSGTYYSDKHEILFKGCSFRHFLSHSILEKIHISWPHLLLDDQGIDCLARGDENWHLEPEEYDAFIKFVKTIPNRSQLKLGDLEQLLDTELYDKISKQSRKEYKIVDEIIKSRPDVTRTLEYYYLSSFNCNDEYYPEDEPLPPPNCSMVVTGNADDLAKFEAAVIGARGYRHLPFSLDSVVPIYRNKPDFTDFQKEHWGCKNDITYTTVKRTANKIQYDFLLYLYEEDSFPKPFAEILSSKFQNLIFDIQATAEISHYDNKKHDFYYEQTLHKSHAVNGTATYEDNTTISDTSIYKPVGGYQDSPQGDWIREPGYENNEIDDDDFPVKPN